jgi:hypothetical protein
MDTEGKEKKIGQKCPAKYLEMRYKVLIIHENS